MGIIQQCFVCYWSSYFYGHLICFLLIWVSIGLGLHNFGFYIHNDTLQGLQRTEDIFGDLSIQLKPVVGTLFCNLGGQLLLFVKLG